MEKKLFFDCFSAKFTFQEVWNFKKVKIWTNNGQFILKWRFPLKRWFHTHHEPSTNSPQSRMNWFLKSALKFKKSVKILSVHRKYSNCCKVFPEKSSKARYRFSALFLSACIWQSSDWRQPMKLQWQQDLLWSRKG